MATFLYSPCRILKDFLIQVAFEISPQILIAYNLAVCRFHQDDVGVVLIS